MAASRWAASPLPMPSDSAIYTLSPTSKASHWSPQSFSPFLGRRALAVRQVMALRRGGAVLGVGVSACATCRYCSRARR